MDSLQELIRQKNEIERKIKEIKNAGFVTVGNVKIENDPSNNKLWYLAVRCVFHSRANIPPDHERYQESWRKIVIESSREDVVKKIPEIVKNLQAIYNSEANNEEQSCQ